MKNMIGLEQLEPRIAPAGITLVNGANLLSAGDQGNLSEADPASDATTLVKCSAGKALVFWDATAREIKGISVADGVNLEVLGNITGDVVTNLEASGFLSDSDNNPDNGLDGGKLLPSSIAGIKTNAYFDSKGKAQNGDAGRIVAGGSISNVTLNGDLKGAYAGDGIFDAVASAALPNGSTAPVGGTPDTSFKFDLGMNFDKSGKSDISTMTLKMSDATFSNTASINNVSFAGGTNVGFFSGDGAAGAAGGSISKVSFVGAIVDAGATGFFTGKSYVVSAGDGGNSATNGVGGAGGNIAGITETGSGGNVYIHSGIGGDGGAAGGNGGVGGSVATLDLQGGVIAYDIQSGHGGNGTAGGAGGGVSYANITSQGPISLAGPFSSTMGADQKDFFVINRSTGEMTLVNGTTLDAGTIIPALASDPVDAIASDLNQDGYLDVAIVYGDGSLGTLINHAGDGTFDYTVKDLGFKPAKILAGDFVGDGDNPELAIIATSKLQTTLKLYSAADPTDAANFLSDTSKFRPLVLKMGNLADVAGGDPAGSLGSPMQLNPKEIVPHSDLTLAFAAGTLQGIVSQGSGTTGDPFYFATKYTDPDGKTFNAPKVKFGSGIRDIDFNFAGVHKFIAEQFIAEQSIAVVSANGAAASLVVIDKAPPPPPVDGEPAPVASDQFVFNVKAALPLPGGSGTILQAAWTAAALSRGDSPVLMLLTSTSTKSNFLIYGNYDATAGLMKLQDTYSVDFLVNSTANNFQFASEADSHIFTTGYVTMALAYQNVFPVATEPQAFALPFPGKDIQLKTGAGGNGTLGAGGSGGDIRSLNFDSNFATIAAGGGGLSQSGACGNGGSIYNAAAFSTGSARITPTMAVTDSLTVSAGDGATVTGTATSSRGGHGGSISGVTFNTTGHIVGSDLVRGDMALAAGKGGSSQSLAAGNGGSISSTAITNARNIQITAGAGGVGTLGVNAAGGNGGSITGILGGDTSNTGTREITGSLIATAGMGGNSENASAGAGGNVSTVNVSSIKSQASAFNLTAGKGGDSSGLSVSANAGAGGSVIGVTALELKVNPNMVAGTGGNAVNGSGGTGGSIRNFTYEGGLLNLTSGLGGNSTGVSGTGTGGAGGSISGINASIKGSGYMTVEASRGGSGVGAGGGAGGTVTSSSFKLNPLDRSTGDETLGVTVKSGIGGNGSRGGAGGLISGVSCEGVYDNPGNDGFVTVIDSIAMKFEAGNGGTGSAGDGGAGGSINFGKTLLGISQIDADSTNPDFLPGDEALRVSAGNGGDGAVKGGAGGSVNSLKAANVKANNLGDPIPLNILSSAFVRSGDGGDGGSGDGGFGGSVVSTRLTVERQQNELTDNGNIVEPQQNELTGNIRILTGEGGNSVAAKGGSGGSLQNSTFTAINGNNDDGYAALLQTGSGGTGAKSGGAGGNIASITLAVTSVGIDGTNANIYSAVILAGSGGNGTGVSKATGGAGGSISGITQPAGVYSVINLIQAGSGGNSSTDIAGAIGGSVTNVISQGYIGALTAAGSPQGLYNSVPVSDDIDPLVPDKHQGVFSGLGGTGSARGLNGSVTGVSAPAIAAIAAANLSGTFDQAAVVSKIAALYHPGFDMDNSGTYSPGDGYIRASKFDPAKDLVSLDLKIVTTANLVTKTIPFVNPVP